MFIFRWF